MSYSLCSRKIEAGTEGGAYSALLYCLAIFLTQVRSDCVVTHVTGASVRSSRPVQSVPEEGSAD